MVVAVECMDWPTGESNDVDAIQHIGKLRRILGHPRHGSATALVKVSAGAASLLLAATVFGRSQGITTAPPPRVIDLTHALDEDFPYIPVPGITFPFKLTPIATLEKNGVAANRW